MPEIETVPEVQPESAPQVETKPPVDPDKAFKDRVGTSIIDGHFTKKVIGFDADKRTFQLQNGGKVETCGTPLVMTQEPIIKEVDPGM